MAPNCKADVYGRNPATGFIEWHKCGNQPSAVRGDGLCSIADWLPSHVEREHLVAGSGPDGQTPASAGVSDLDALLAGEPPVDDEIRILPRTSVDGDEMEILAYAAMISGERLERDQTGRIAAYPSRLNIGLSQLFDFASRTPRRDDLQLLKPLTRALLDVGVRDAEEALMLGTELAQSVLDEVGGRLSPEAREKVAAAISAARDRSDQAVEVEPSSAPLPQLAAAVRRLGRAAAHEDWREADSAMVDVSGYAYFVVRGCIPPPVGGSDAHRNAVRDEGAASWCRHALERLANFATTGRA